MDRLPGTRASCRPSEKKNTRLPKHPIKATFRYRERPRRSQSSPGSSNPPRTLPAPEELRHSACQIVPTERIRASRSLRQGPVEDSCLPALQGSKNLPAPLPASVPCATTVVMMARAFRSGALSTRFLLEESRPIPATLGHILLHRPILHPFHDPLLWRRTIRSAAPSRLLLSTFQGQ